MKNFILSIGFVFAGFYLCAPSALAGDMQLGDFAPEVEYITPGSQREVDLSGKETLAFRWKPVPMPANGRRSYKITVFKEFSYEVVFKQTLDPQTTSIEIPSTFFKKGSLYTWQVKQRARWGGAWSMDNRWSFTVKE